MSSDPPPPDAAPDDLSAGGPTRQRLGVRGELVLVTLPVVVVLVVLVAVDGFSDRDLLFTSLASSAFLIYLDPLHRMNRVGTLALAQATAAALGFGVAWVGGAGYASSSVAMVALILLMVTTDRMHPPAVSTVLAFSLRPSTASALELFGSALGLTVVLVLLSLGSTRLLRRLTRGGRKPIAEAVADELKGGKDRG